MLATPTVAQIDPHIFLQLNYCFLSPFREFFFTEFRLIWRPWPVALQQSLLLSPSIITIIIPSPFRARIIINIAILLYKNSFIILLPAASNAMKSHNSLLGNVDQRRQSIRGSIIRVFVARDASRYETRYVSGHAFYHRGIITVPRSFPGARFPRSFYGQVSRRVIIVPPSSTCYGIFDIRLHCARVNESANSPSFANSLFLLFFNIDSSLLISLLPSPALFSQSSLDLVNYVSVKCLSESDNNTSLLGAN